MTNGVVKSSYLRTSCLFQEHAWNELVCLVSFLSVFAISKWIASEVHHILVECLFNNKILSLLPLCKGFLG